MSGLGGNAGGFGVVLRGPGTDVGSMTCVESIDVGEGSSMNESKDGAKARIDGALANYAPQKSSPPSYSDTFTNERR